MLDVLAPRQPAALDAVFFALSDQTRRGLLGRLRGAELTAGALADGFQVTRPAVSRHLRILREAHLVREKRRGRERVYTLTAEPLAGATTWLEDYRAFWSARLADLKSLIEALPDDPADEPVSVPPAAQESAASPPSAIAAAPLTAVAAAPLTAVAAAPVTAVAAAPLTAVAAAPLTAVAAAPLTAVAAAPEAAVAAAPEAAVAADSPRSSSTASQHAQPDASPAVRPDAASAPPSARSLTSSSSSSPPAAEPASSSTAADPSSPRSPR